jgi:membrane-associated phospholipid phosphatase
MSILVLDAKISEQVRLLGARTYAFWRQVAVNLLNLYFICAIAFAVLHWLSVFHVIVVGLTSYICALIIQRLVARERPAFEKLTGYKMWWRTYSFPSAHATLSAGLATALILFTNFPSNEARIGFSLLFILTALLIGLSRIIVGVHYVIDITVGFILGTSIAFLYAQAVL